jgi:hypothetical protein
VGLRVVFLRNQVSLPNLLVNLNRRFKTVKGEDSEGNALILFSRSTELKLVDEEQVY